MMTDRQRKKGTDNAIGLYVHIPFCIRKCEYCDFLSGPYDERTQQRYVAALCREAAYLGRQLPQTAIGTVYVGGGTPSWLRGEDMERLFSQLRESFRILSDAEITVECNPGTVTEEKFRTYRGLGINRLSIGLQSANDDELRLLGRIHTYERFLHTFALARECGFSNISVDIMTGLPRQTTDKLSHTLSGVVALKPEHISVYALTIEKGTPFYDRYQFDAVKQHAGMETEELPNEEDEYRLYRLARESLEAAGYGRYEISNYAREGYACRHNVGYWERRPYIGMGIGAAGFCDNMRTKNVTDIYDYMERLECGLPGDAEEPDAAQTVFHSVLWEEKTELSRRDAMAEFMFLGLRMIPGISREEFCRVFGVPIEGVYGEVLRRLQEQELLVMAQGRIFLTERGRDVSNVVLSQFLL